MTDIAAFSASVGDRSVPAVSRLGLRDASGDYMIEKKGAAAELDEWRRRGLRRPGRPRSARSRTPAAGHGSSYLRGAGVPDRLVAATADGAVQLFDALRAAGRGATGRAARPRLGPGELLPLTVGPNYPLTLAEYASQATQNDVLTGESLAAAALLFTAVIAIALAVIAVRLAKDPQGA